MGTISRTLLAALLLFVLLGSAKVMLEHHLAPRTSGIQGELSGPRPEIVLVGSSHTRQGYDVAALEKITGLRSFVVAYDGLDPANMVPLVRAVLRQAGKRPKFLVVDAYCATFAREPEIEDPRLFFDAPPEMKKEIAEAYLRTHKGEEAWLDLWTLATNKGSELILTFPLVSRTLNGLSYHGGYTGKTVSGVEPERFAGLHLPLSGSVLREEQAAALSTIRSLANEAQVRLLLADAPMPGPVESQPEVIAMQRQVRELAGRLEIPLFEGANGFPVGDPALFHDSNHLSTAGREMYTEQFGKALLQLAAR